MDWETYINNLEIMTEDECYLEDEGRLILDAPDDQAYDQWNYNKFKEEERRALNLPLRIIKAQGGTLDDF